MATNTVTVINRGVGSIEVHKPGCRDLARDAEGASVWDVKASSFKDVVLDVYDPGDFQYDPANWQNYAGDIVTMPCCPNLDATKTVKAGSRYNPEYAKAYRARAAARYPIAITMN